ncbi:DUF2769 domain-containing protein [Candidatus Thorarchaeota archaeon]|nr:MAG: DUF2769 domain-containing protein [Candidatus Thorarchaeota archaeon]
MKSVPDTEENVEICRHFCGPCPTFQSNELRKEEPKLLFCSRGVSKKPNEDIDDMGCNCPQCEVFEKYELEGGWFCIHGTEGRQ